MPDEQSLLRCAVKKTASVVAKHVEYAIYVIAAFIGVYVTIRTFSTIYPAIVVAGAFIASMVSAIVSVFSMVPWYVYVIAGVAIAYFGYGLAWCIARDLTEEDWTSRMTIKYVGVMATVLLATYLASGVALCYSGFLRSPMLVVVTFACTTVVSFGLSIVCVEYAWEVSGSSKPATPGTLYYFFRFPAAAYHHYYVKKQP